MFVFSLLYCKLKEVDKTSSTSRKAQAGWLGQFFPLKNFTPVEDALHKSAGRFSHVEHIINGRCAGSRPVSRFDSGGLRFTTDYE